MYGRSFFAAFILAVLCGCSENQIPATTIGSGIATGQQSVRANFTADIIKVTPMSEPLPPKNTLKGHVIDANPKWEIELNVLPHMAKIPFQPGVSRCYIADVSVVFGTPAAEVAGQYEFTYIWNVHIPGKPEFENFKARRIGAQNR